MFTRSLKLITIGSALLLLGAGCISFGSSNTTATATPMGMFRSGDKAETWTQINAYPTPSGVKSLSGVEVYKFFFDPGDPNAVYLATRGQGLFYSYNKGDSWMYAEALGKKFISSVVVDPANKCNVYVADQSSHMYKTNDCSRTWTQMYADARPDEWVVSMSFNSRTHRLYAALRGGELLASGDDGASWQMLHRFKSQLQYMTLDPKNQNRIYVASPFAGMARSDDSGVTWTILSDGFDPYGDSRTFYRLVIDPTASSTLYWVSQYGILKSVDAGKSWQDLKLITAPGSVTIYAFAVNPNNAKEIYYTSSVIGGGASRSTLYKSLDGGTTWLSKKLPSGAQPVYMAVHPSDGNILYLGYMAVPKQ